MTTPADAEHAAHYGADAIGLNFYARSPRCVPADAVETILRDLPAQTSAVGVFVGEPLDRIRDLTARLSNLHTIQWHGDEHPPLGTFAMRYIAAFAVVNQDSLLGITRYLDHCRQHGRLPDALLLDAHAPGLYGGTGRTAPWELLANFQPGVPIILAGGLTPDNVADAVRTVRPYAVDVASGVESRPGIKDPDKVRRFIDNARSAVPDSASLVPGPSSLVPGPRSLVPSPKSKVQGLWSAAGPLPNIE